MNKKLTTVLCAIIGIAAIIFGTRKSDKSNDAETEDVAEASSPSSDTESNTSGTIDAFASTTTNTATNFHQPAKLKDRPEMIVKHSGHVLSYNTKNNTPNWVAWMLTKAMLHGKLERSNKFWADPSIPKSNRVDYYEYKESGYGRGHMCPAGDNKWSQDAMHDCFYMSNMCPQNPTLNEYSWNDLETQCRTWAAHEGTIFICCGPYYDKAKRHQEIGIHHKILVPDGFFKVVLSLRSGHEKAIGFYYTNTKNSQSMENTACSVDDIESKTGINFFADLDDALENKVESMNNINAWK